MTDADIERNESQGALDAPSKPDRGIISPLIYLFIFAVIVADVCWLGLKPDFMVDQRARDTLREIGQSQIAYRNSNNNKFYATFYALQRMGFILPDKTPTTIIKSYSLSWEVTRPYCDWGNQPSVTNGFTIVASPTRHRMLHMVLKTYAITDDQVLREFVPSNGNKLDEVQTWDPVIEP